MKAKRIVMAVAVLVLVIAMACALVSCDFFGGGSGDKDTTYEVTVQCDTSLGSVSGGGKFKQGDSVTIIATANEGYFFAGWYDGDKLVYDSAEFNFTIYDKDIKYTAKFSVDQDFEKFSIHQNDDGKFVVSGVRDKSMSEIVLPSYISIITNYAFKNCVNLTSVTIPDSMTSIGDYAFYGCSNITEVKFNGTIGQWVAISGLDNLMGNGSNKNLFIGGSEIIGDIVIPDGITSINPYTFNNCNGITSVTIPNSVTSIDWNAFDGCSNISEVKYNGTIKQWCAISGLGGLMKEGSNKKLYIGDNEITGDLVIPDSVTSIGSYAFYDCSSLTSVTIPNSVTSIGDDAFEDCSNISEVKFNGTIGQWCAISGLGYLMGRYNKKLYIGGNEITGDLVIPDTVTSIGWGAFRGCSSLTSVIIGNSVTSIGNQAFSDCYALSEVYNLSKLNITKGSSSYGYVAHYALDVYTSLSEPSKLTEKDGMILHADGNNVTLVKYIGDATSVIIPDGVTSIGSYAFSGCSSLTNVTMPDSVTSIGNYAFSRCSGLTSITIPDSVTSIGWSAFSNCYALAEVYNLSSLNIAKGSGDYGDVALYARDVYTSLSEPSKLSEKDGMILHTDGINVTLVRYIGDKTSAIIPNSVTSIGDWAFYGCSSLTSVTIGNSVTSIGERAFYDCSSLTSITIPNSVTSIGSSAFDDCSSLTSITMGNSVTSIGNYAFKDCSSLASVAIPNSVTSIGYSAFEGCGNLASVTIPDSVTSIGVRTFSGCSGLTSVAIPDSVTSIGWGAFEYCSSLTSVIIPDSVTSIGNRTFYNCSSLTSVIFENTTGWFVSKSSNATSGTDLIVIDPSQNAKYLKDTYRNYYWKRG